MKKSPAYSGQVLTWVKTMMLSRGEGPREARCATWGCLLPTSKTSPFGTGPVCEVCRYGLRPVAFPAKEVERWTE